MWCPGFAGGPLYCHGNHLHSHGDIQLSGIAWRNGWMKESNDWLIVISSIFYTDWMAHWLIHWLSDWLTDSLTDTTHLITVSMAMEWLDFFSWSLEALDSSSLIDFLLSSSPLLSFFLFSLSFSLSFCSSGTFYQNERYFNKVADVNSCKSVKIT